MKFSPSKLSHTAYAVGVVAKWLMALWE